MYYVKKCVDFADQDIKKITFSTMEISQMDNGTITKVHNM